MKRQVVLLALALMAAGPACLQAVDAGTTPPDTADAGAPQDAGAPPDGGGGCLPVRAGSCVFPGLQDFSGVCSFKSLCTDNFHTSLLCDGTTCRCYSDDARGTTTGRTFAAGPEACIERTLHTLWECQCGFAPLEALDGGIGFADASAVGGDVGTAVRDAGGGPGDARPVFADAGTGAGDGDGGPPGCRNPQDAGAPRCTFVGIGSTAPDSCFSKSGCPDGRWLTCVGSACTCEWDEGGLRHSLQIVGGPDRCTDLGFRQAWRCQCGFPPLE